MILLSFLVCDACKTDCGGNAVSDCDACEDDALTEDGDTLTALVKSNGLLRSLRLGKMLVNLGAIRDFVNMSANCCFPKMKKTRRDLLRTQL